MSILVLILCIVLFCFLWFLAFKAKIKYDNKKPLRNIQQKIEKQDQKFIVDGKEKDLKKELGLAFSERDQKIRELETKISQTHKNIVQKEARLNNPKLQELENYKDAILNKKATYEVIKKGKKTTITRRKPIEEIQRSDFPKPQEDTKAVTNQKTGITYIIKGGKVIDTIKD